jgi:myosin I
MLTPSGWWLCKNLTTQAQGWAPAAYVEEIVQEARAPPPPPPPPAAPARPVPAVAVNGSQAAARAGPPAPPAKRPVAGGRKPIPPPAPARDSQASLGSTATLNSNSGGSGANSGRSTPNSVGGGSLAGGLAEALRARQTAMSGTRKDDDDDW